MADGSTYIGKQIGNYRLVTELAHSHYSRVFRGEHIFLPQRIVAIKLLHAYLSSQEESERFLREARFLAMLKHRYILPVIDVGIDEGLPYLVVEYAQRGSLRDRLQRNSAPDPQPLPLDEALMILRQVGQALHYAHQQNIVHRDLKPENILFNNNGEALLADFNIATMLETAITKPVDIIGSPYYMAPEQFEGVVSKRSDQYALACIAYELFTGRRPFNAPNAFALGLKHKSESPNPPTHFNPQLPTYIEQAVLKAMAKERTDRYINVSYFIAALSATPAQKAKEQSAIQSGGLPSLRHYEETLAAYEQAILNPNSAIFHCKRGNLLYDRKRDEEALQAYEQAIQFDPNLAEAYKGKGNTLFYLNHYEEALAAYEQAIRLDPAITEAYDGKGWSLWYLKRYGEALTSYEQAIERNPRYSSAYHGKGNVLLELKHYEDACRAYEEAIRLDPTLTYGYIGKGNALLQLRRYEEALEAFDKAISLDPKFAYAYNCKGNSLWDLNRYEEALANYERAISLDPGAAHYHRKKADVLRLLGRTKEAQQAYERARQLGYGG